jgi:uncharacterized membrane protein YuzA (DUF378 family)
MTIIYWITGLAAVLIIVGFIKLIRKNKKSGSPPDDRYPLW